MFKFSGWSVMGTFSDMSAVHGLNAVLNFFLSVTVNAAFGIAMQLVNAINLLAGNFQMAFRPQITKNYAAKDEQAFLDLVFRASRFSYFLLLLVAVPFVTGNKEILRIWLGTPPPLTSEFCIFLLCAVMIDAISAPLWMSAQAAGNIRNYQIMISLSILSILPLSYIILSCGGSPVLVVAVKALTNLISHIIRLLYLNKRINFPVLRYINEVMRPILIQTIIVIFFTWSLSLIWVNIPYYIHMLIGLIITGVATYMIGITSEERQYIKVIINKKWTT
jgi:O-antigen/teichoic acid export membrane protein